ncbi:hypothetical protein [Mycolicibacterium mageritense]|nr:hypothetical protein [Mycolicibacterium mageritense]
MSSRVDLRRGCRTLVVKELPQAVPLAAAPSMPASTVPGMDSDDTVDSGD